MTAAVETRSLEQMLGRALELRRQPLRTLARAISDGYVQLPAEPLDIPRFVTYGSESHEPDNTPLRAALLLMWLTGTGLEQRWLDEIVPALHNEVTHLHWFPRTQELYVETN